MTKNFDYINDLEKGRNKIYDKKRKCLIPNCDRDAIANSHVLQRKRILEKIKDNTNKFYVLDKTSLHNKEHSGLLTPKKMGIKESYVFPGFCESCDRDFFSEIETVKLDFRRRRIKTLFAYRALCVELRHKEIYLESTIHIRETRKKHFPKVIDYFDVRPINLAISDLNFYKKELEAELLDGKQRFKHFQYRLPQRKVCFSSAVSIYDEHNPLTFEFDEYGQTRTEPIVVSILNYFPYQESSYFLASIHKKYPCRWTNNLLKKIKSLEQSVDKEISDIITYRIDFWAISPTILETWSEEKLKKFNYESDINADNYAFEIESNFNMWD